MRPRPAFRLWHRWFGILGGAWLFLLAITGSAIAWYDEIDGLLNPDLRIAEISRGSPASIDDLVANARVALPGFEPSNILISREPDRNHWLLGRQTLADGSSRPVQVFADPGTGAFAGWRESGKVSLHRHQIPDLLYGLHTDLLMGEAGMIFVGLVSLAWLIDHFLSLPLAFPRLKTWLSAWCVGGHAGSLRQLWDRHRAGGVWLWPVSAVLALTGVTLSFPMESREIVQIVSPISDRLHYTLEQRAPPTNPIPLEAAIAAATDDRRLLHSLRLLPEVGLYAVRTFDERDVDNQDRLWTYVDMQTGRVTAERHDAGTSDGDAFFVWQYALHSGHAFGLVGRLIVTLAGIVTAYLCFTGYRLWWRRRRKKSGRKRREISTPLREQAPDTGKSGRD
ncbi:PepSY domain-containing protein [Erythrobacter arachoides]|uniref:PepSY domain-containing protein n=1 Tax=Aurantiacibacter arachoides TaxID=1850444 RepID=A0A845A2G0_9SPHN|nr:PepSY-associated TM helix domain-containing protein [Aurantiacibacter arachoides]MXO93884.1 PepSY domain-containing protein [Aurantiacibacter arachoides]GGD45937.1 hypothetical protein GCM10011411_01930 [Aurantiacibacter arachoides]